MDRSDDVRIYNASCELFEGLLRLIEPRSAARRELTVMPGDGDGQEHDQRFRQRTEVEIEWQRG